MARIRALYGASPLHLLAHLAAFALVAFALLQIAGTNTAMRIGLWLVASVVLHDLVLLPFYGALDRVERAALGRSVNYVRVPALFSGLLLLVFLPSIAGEGAPAFRRVSGLEPEGYLERWLLVSAGMFALAGAVYLLRGRGGGSRS
jgi:hypothetical protein